MQAAPVLFNREATVEKTCRLIREAAAILSSKLVKKTVLKIYPGGTHSLGDTSKDQVNKDLLALFKQ